MANGPLTDISGSVFGSDPYSDALLDLSPNMVLFLDTDDSVLKISGRTLEYLRYGDRSEVVGRNVLSVIRNPVLQLLARKWLEKLNKGMEIDESFPLERENNDQFAWFHIRAVNVNREGRLFGKVVFVSDVTELFSQKKILDTLMGSIPGDVLVFDRAFNILLMSEPLARENGFHSWRDAVGRSLRDMPFLDTVKIEQMRDSLLRDDEPSHQVFKAFTGEEKNDPRWYYADLRQIKSSTGVFGYILTRFDMTGEIKPRAILEGIMASVSDTIAIVNPEGIVEYASNPLAKALGYREWSDATGMLWTDLFRFADSEGNKLSAIFAGDYTETRQGTLSFHLGGEKLSFNYRVNPLRYQDQNFGVIAIATNTTELVDARDRAESAVRAKAAFLANMSHELRTPMNAVLGMNELLSRTPLTSLQKNYVSHIRSSASLLLSIINDILDFSRIEDRKMELAIAEYSVNSLLHDVINLVAVKVVEKELAFTVDLDPALPSILIGDEIRVKQVLINLLNNAVKFTESGEINLTVNTGYSSERQSVVVYFRIRDTGIGIPKDKQKELFERFSRVDNLRTAGVEGSGLGLSICKGLVSMMGGKLSVESDEGAGSVFTAEITQQVPPKSEPIAVFRYTSGVSVLVYESDQRVLASIRRMADRAHIRADFCSTPAEFAERLGGTYFDWTHIIFEYRSGYQSALESVDTFPRVRWMALLAMNDFVGKGKHPSIDFIFKPLALPVFARFIAGEHVDFSKGLPLVTSLGVSSLYFQAIGVEVLVVDDSLVNLKVAEGFLQTLDIRVDTAESGAEAIQLATKKKYDLILMDHMMPEMDGLETTSRIRAIPGYREVPIIALTANIGSSYKELYGAAGMSDTLYKPIEFNAFVACLRKWIPSDKRRNETDGASVAVDEAANQETLPVPAQANPASPAAGEPGGNADGVAEDEASANVTPSPDDADGSSVPREWIAGLDYEKGIEFTGTPQNLEAVLGIFTRAGPKMLDALEAGRRSGNQGQFRTAAHSLISACANIGATALSVRARELEQAILAGKADDADRLYPLVHAELGRLIGAVGEHVEKPAKGSAS